ISPGPGSPTSMSTIWSSSGPPWRSIRTALLIISAVSRQHMKKSEARIVPRLPPARRPPGLPGRVGRHADAAPLALDRFPFDRAASAVGRQCRGRTAGARPGVAAHAELRALGHRLRAAAAARLAGPAPQQPAVGALEALRGARPA